MTYAPVVEGYETTVDKRAEFFQNGAFVPVGDPVKAAQAMIGLAEHPEPPVHLILGSEAAGMLRSADETRRAEFEQWLPVTISTDHAAATNFLQTEYGKALLGGKD
jgi:hypothetical protein